MWFRFLPPAVGPASVPSAASWRMSSSFDYRIRERFRGNSAARAHRLKTIGIESRGGCDRARLREPAHHKPCANVLPAVPERSFPLIRAKTILKHKRNHPESEPKRLPEIAGDGRLSYTAAIIDRDFDKGNPVGDSLHQ